MQVIASERRLAGVPGRGSVIAAFFVGTILLFGAASLAMLVFGTDFLQAFMPRGRPTTFEQIQGALAWTFALTAPTGFGLVGFARLSTAVDRMRARRPRPTPVARLASSIGDDHVVAARVPLPDGSRLVPEVVVGPFGMAVIEELPPERAVLSRGPRTWEVRKADRKKHMIENPLERAWRDAERMRSWIEGDDRDHIVKVYAAVVGTDPNVQRTPTCAVLGPKEVAAWLASLPPQRSFDAERRESVVAMIREAL
jgi:hypothetical protein